MQGIEYTIDPTLQRWNVRLLERIEIFVASPNCPRNKNWHLECGVLITKSFSSIFKEPIKFPMHRIKHENFMHRHETAREINVPLQRHKIGCLGLRFRAISALAVDQVYLGFPETPIRAGKGSGLAEISVIHWVAPLKHWGESHWKSTSQACAAERFWPWPSITWSRNTNPRGEKCWNISAAISASIFSDSRQHDIFWLILASRAHLNNVIRLHTAQWKFS